MALTRLRRCAGWSAPLLFGCKKSGFLASKTIICDTILQKNKKKTHENFSKDSWKQAHLDMDFDTRKSVFGVSNNSLTRFGDLLLSCQPKVT